MENNARCPKCNADFFADFGEHTLVCPECGENIEAIRARKYFSVFHNKSTAKDVHGKDYFKYDEYLRIGSHHLENQEFELAKESYMQAVGMNPGDYRGYMGVVAAETKNYTDLKNETHKQFLQKALSVASEEQQKHIAASYKVYGLKASMSDEEYAEYLSEKQKDFKGRVKRAIIGLSKKNDADKKSTKTAIIFGFIMLGLGIASMVLGIALNLLIFMLLGLCLIVGIYAPLSVVQKTRFNQSVYELLLGLFNELVKYKLSPEQNDKTLDYMSAILISVRDGEPLHKTELYVRALVEYSIEIGCVEMQKCLKTHKIAAKHAPK